MCFKIMPARWMHDEEAEVCLQCQAEFNPIRRRHHCRYCGKIYCDDCSTQRMLVPREALVYPPSSQTNVFMFETDPCEPQRVCIGCSGELIRQQDELRKTMSKASQANFIDRESIERYINSPIQFTMEAEIRKAAYTLLNFTSDNAIEGADTIPRELIWGAKGLAFLTIVKAGFFFTGRLGSGVVVGRNDDGSWSAPSAIACTGVGWGFQIGGEVTDLLIILNSRSALQAFASNAQISLGTELSVSLGPLGRTAATDVHAGDKGVSAVFSYAHSKGLFLGVSLEAGIVISRPDINETFYGMRVSSTDLLMGRVPAPKAGEPLYAALREVMGNGPYDDDYNDPYALAASGHSSTSGRGYASSSSSSSSASYGYPVRGGAHGTTYDEDYEYGYRRGSRDPYDERPMRAAYPNDTFGDQRKRNNHGATYDTYINNIAGRRQGNGYHEVPTDNLTGPLRHRNTVTSPTSETRNGVSSHTQSGVSGVSDAEAEDQVDEWMHERQQRLSASREVRSEDGQGVKELDVLRSPAPVTRQKPATRDDPHAAAAAHKDMDEIEL